MKTFFRLTAVVVALASVSACNSTKANTSLYSPNEAMKASQVEYGIIVSGRMVELRNIPGETDKFAGAALGGVAGALVGDQFGSGTGKTLMTGLGAIAGAALAADTAQKVNRADAVEWIVKLDNGRSISVVQSDPGIYRGMRVSVITSGTKSRIVPI